MSKKSGTIDNKKKQKNANAENNNIEDNNNEALNNQNDIIENSIIKAPNNTDINNEVPNIKAENGEQPDIESNKKKKKLLDNNFVRLLVAILVLALCAGIGIGMAIYEDKADPTNFVAQYFGKFLVQRYEEMLDLSDTEGALIPEGKFTELMKQFRKEHDIGDYELDKPAVDEAGRYFVRVKYKDLTTEKDGDWDIYLSQDKNVIANAIVDWKIDISEYLANNFQVTVPSDMKLTIDGVEIDSSNSTKENSVNNTIITESGESITIKTDDNEQEEVGDTVVYTITSIVKGKHKLKATGKYTTIVSEVEVYNDNVTGVLELKDQVVSGSYKDRVVEMTEEFIQEYYDTVKDRKNSNKTLMAYLNNDKKLKSSLKKLADKDIENIYWPDVKDIEEYSLKDREFSEIDTKVTYKEDAKFNVVCKYSFTYKSATKASLYDSFVSSISGKCTVKLKLTFEIIKDKLKITSIKMERQNKKN